MEYLRLNIARMTADRSISGLDTVDRIEMRGYQGIQLLGTTLHLLRAPAELPNCLASQSDPSQESAK
jgi:hypothetical protein